MKKWDSDRRFRLIALIVMLVWTVICLAPFVLMISASITDEQTLIREGYKFWPQKVNFAAYQYLWAKRDTIFNAYMISIIVTVVGTFTNVLITTLFAYPLARRDFKWRNVFAFVVFFTMLFNGGMTASYIIWTQVFHIRNTIWALIIPNYLMGGMNILLVRNYYTASIPDAILEAARVDGASEMTIYTRIMVPLSKPVMITVALFAGIAYWNDWTNGLYYINDAKLYSIQNLLNKMIQDIQALQANASASASSAIMQIPTVSVRMAIAFVALVPILIIYPFLQKYFAEGIALGAVKG